MEELQHLKNRLGYITIEIGNAPESERATVEDMYAAEINTITNRILELEANG